MFASLSCSLSLPSKKGYLGSPASFCCRSPPSPKFRWGALTSGEGCCSLYSLPRGKRRREGGAPLLLLKLNDVFHGGTGRERGKRTLPGLVGPAWHRHPRSCAGWEAAGCCRVPAHPAGKESPSGGRDGGRQREGAGSSPQTPSTLICLVSRVYLQGYAENSCASRASPSKPGRDSPGLGFSPQVLSFSRSSPSHRAPAGTETQTPRIGL